MTPSDLIKTADKLLSASAGRRPLQSDLKRAISTAYYAMFHALCKNSADCLVGTAGANRSERAWRQMYRSIDHGFARAQCKNKQVIKRFPDDIRTFASDFVDLQQKRTGADYDPASEFKIEDAQTWLETATVDISRLENAPVKDRRAFAVWVAVKDRV